MCSNGFAGAVGNERIFEAEEVEDAVEADCRKRLRGILLDLGFGVEGDAQSGGGKHGQVVGAVADGYGLFYVDVFDLCDDAKQFGFAFAVNDVADVTSGEFAVGDLEFVGVDEVKAIELFQVVSEVNPPERIAVL